MSKIGDFFKGIGSTITGNGLLSLGGSLASLFGGNRNIDKQIKAQASENQKNRDYNLMLAKLQNQWNQEQWERENDYNSPESQMARFKKAGLNPDLIYGQGSSGNAFQLSGGMTSGSPSSPQDFTALGQKMTVGEAVKSALDTDLVRAQIENIKADSEQKRVNSGLSRIDLETKTALQKMFGDDAEQLIDKYGKSNAFVRNYLVQLASLEKDYGIKANTLSSGSLDVEMKRIDRDFHSAKVDKLLQKLSNEVDLSDAQLKEFLKSTVYRVRGIKAQTELSESESLWNDPTFLEKLPNGLPTMVKLLRMILK